MTIIPAMLKVAVETALQTRVEHGILVGGGDISQAARLILADGRSVLVKWQAGGPAGLFTAEQRGLARLREAVSGLSVPQVLVHSEETSTAPAFIVLEWLEAGPKTTGAAEALAEGLAELHRVTDKLYGLDHDNFIGASPQPNQQMDRWPDFFREQRLGFQLDLAHQQGYLSARQSRLAETLLARLANWLPDRPPASLLHGDLWGGNWLAINPSGAALIDPAIYYGHREAELAFTELFGGFSARFYAAYNAAWPLESGYEERRTLYNLYHLLNHLNLFGSGYLGAVDQILNKYGA